jgi:hypothetical protein
VQLQLPLTQGSSASGMQSEIASAILPEPGFVLSPCKCKSSSNTSRFSSPQYDPAQVAHRHTGAYANFFGQIRGFLYFLGSLAGVSIAICEGIVSEGHGHSGNHTSCGGEDRPQSVNRAG